MTFSPFYKYECMIVKAAAESLAYTVESMLKSKVFEVFGWIVWGFVVILAHPQLQTLVFELQILISVELEKPLRWFCVNPLVYTCLLGLNKWQQGSRSCAWVAWSMANQYSSLVLDEYAWQCGFGIKICMPLKFWLVLGWGIGFCILQEEYNGPKSKAHKMPLSKRRKH